MEDKTKLEKLLAIMFLYMDGDMRSGFIKDEQLRRIARALDKDIVDVTNCYIAYTWALQDEADPDYVIHSFLIK